MRSEPVKSVDRTRRATGAIILVFTMLSALGGWLALPPGYLSIPEFRRFVGLAPATPGPSHATPSAGNSNSGTTASPVVQGKPEARPPDEGNSAQLPYIGGVWRSSSRFAHTYIFAQTGNSFEIYQDDPKAGHVKIGSGRVMKNGVTATVRTIKEQRLAMVSLQLSADGQTLEGSFSGTAPQEKDFALKLSRASN
jgi:hypothetical protein